MDNNIVSPCISICKTDPLTGYCYGCARTNEEKKLWKNENTRKEWKIKNLEIIKYLNYKQKSQTILKYIKIPKQLYIPKY